MKIRDVMRPGPFTIAEAEVLGVAYAAMKRSHIRHLPVVSDGKLVGMLSERDVLAVRARPDAKSSQPPSFEMLYEVTGYGRTNLDARLVHAGKLNYQEIWGGNFLHAKE